MTFYLSKWSGAGTYAGGPFEPTVVYNDAGTPWRCIDLRPDASVQAGYCFVWTAFPVSPLPNGAWLVAAAADDALTANVRNAIRQETGVDLAAGSTLRQAVRQMMTVEATGPANGRWNPLLPSGGQFRLVLGDLADEWLA